MESIKEKLKQHLQEMIKKIDIEEDRLSKKFGVDVCFENCNIPDTYVVRFMLNGGLLRGQGMLGDVGKTYGYGRELTMRAAYHISEDNFIKIINAEGFDKYFELCEDDREEFIDKTLYPVAEEQEVFNTDTYQGKSAGQEVDMQQSEFE